LHLPFFFVENNSTFLQVQTHSGLTLHCSTVGRGSLDLRASIKRTPAASLQQQQHAKVSWRCSKGKRQHVQRRWQRGRQRRWQTKAEKVAEKVVEKDDRRQMCRSHYERHHEQHQQSRGSINAGYPDQQIAYAGSRIPGSPKQHHHQNSTSALYPSTVFHPSISNRRQSDNPNYDCIIGNT
jgi:hypothetical protein